MKKSNIAFVLASVCMLASCGSAPKECPQSTSSVTPTSGSVDPVDPSIPTHTHYWKDPVWSWSEDNSEAVATFECSVYHHTHTEVAKKSENKIHIETVIEADHYQDGEDSYVAEVFFNGAFYRSPSHAVKTYQSAHVFNEFGVCEKDEEFLYKDNEIHYDFDPYYYDDRFQGTVEIGEKLKKAGDTVIYKWHVQCEKHSISLTDLNGLEEDEFTLMALFDEGFHELETYDYQHIEANNVYIRIIAKNDKDNPSFVIREDHHLNDVNICHYCYTYYGISMIPGGVAWLGLTEGKKTFLRCQAWPGNTYRLTIGEKLTGHEDWIKFYYVDKYFDPHPYNLSDEFPPDPWEDDETGHFTYIYIVIDSSVTGTGTMIIDQN